MTKTTILTCPRCGSANMVRDASARWNCDAGEWELCCTYDDMTCDDCGAETNECDEVRGDLLPAEWSSPWLDRVRDALARPKMSRTETDRYLAWWAKDNGLASELSPEWVTPCVY